MVILLLASLFNLNVNLDNVDNLLLTWDCSSYASGHRASYKEIFAKSGEKMRIERWFVNPGEKPNPDARSIFIGYGATGTVYSPCCKKQAVKVKNLDPTQALMEIAYACPWWIGLKNSREYNDYEKGALVYAAPYQRVFLDASTKRPKEILYYHLRIEYGSYLNLPGIGSIPRHIRVYDGDKVVLEKNLTVRENVSDALFNGDNLPFKVGNKRMEAGDLPAKGE